MTKVLHHTDLLQLKRHAQIDATRNVFDELIDRYAEAYLEAFPEIKEFSGFEKSGTGNYYIGMIWMNDNEKPDIHQLRIRGSLKIAENRFLELNLTSLDSQQCFFPGQIIAFLGHPFSKTQINVKRLLDSTRIAPRMKSITTDKPIRLFVASGPYMKPDQEDWSIFDKIIETFKIYDGTHLVLLGPFVDIENKAQGHNYDVNWRSCFDKLVQELVDIPCNVYLVPSNRDVLPHYLSSTYFYPSPALEFEVRLKDGVQPKCKITSVSNPAQIDLGGIYLDTTSAEVLFHLNRCASFVNKGGNAFNSMYRQIIAQGIYPMYPPPSDFAVDYPKLIKHTQLDRLGPHIILLPSRFTNSVANVENRLIVTIQKCSTKKQIIMIDIPKIESSMERPTDSIVITDYKHKIMNLYPIDEQMELAIQDATAEQAAAVAAAAATVSPNPVDQSMDDIEVESTGNQMNGAVNEVASKGDDDNDDENFIHIT